VTTIDQMRHKLKTAEGRAVYKMRKQIVEPVFGQIKEARRFSRFSFRGLKKVAADRKTQTAILVARTVFPTRS